MQRTLYGIFILRMWPLSSRCFSSPNKQTNKQRPVGGVDLRAHGMDSFSLPPYKSQEICGCLRPPRPLWAFSGAEMYYTWNCPWLNREKNVGKKCTENTLGPKWSESKPAGAKRAAGLQMEKSDGSSSLPQVHRLGVSHQSHTLPPHRSPAMSALSLLILILLMNLSSIGNPIPISAAAVGGRQSCSA